MFIEYLVGFIVQITLPSETTINNVIIEFPSKENPHNVQELPIDPDKCTVWGRPWIGIITGPYFFKNKEGVALS